MQLPIVGTMLLLFGILRGPVQPDVRDDVSRKLEVRLEATKGEFGSAEEVVLRIVFEKGEERYLEAAFIDTLLFPDRTPPGPITLVKFDFIDEKGAIADRVKDDYGYVDFTRFHPTRLQYLDSSSIYGQYIRPSKWPWNFELEKGRYRVRACVSFAVKSYFDSHPDSKKKLLDIWGWPYEMMYLPDGELVTEEIEFEISDQTVR